MFFLPIVPFTNDPLHHYWYVPLFLVVTIFLGMMSDRSDDVFIPGWVIYVMIVFVVVHIATELLLEVLKCIKANNSGNLATNSGNMAIMLS